MLNGRARESQASSTSEDPQHMEQEGTGERRQKGMTFMGTVGSVGPAPGASPRSGEKSPTDER